jgi:hypothetical protein
MVHLGFPHTVSATCQAFLAKQGLFQTASFKRGAAFFQICEDAARGEADFDFGENQVGSGLSVSVHA